MKINKVLKYTGASIALAGTVTAIPAVITSCSDNKGQYTVSLMVQDYGAWETFTGETITPDESAVWDVGVTKILKVVSSNKQLNPKDFKIKIIKGNDNPAFTMTQNNDGTYTAKCHVTGDMVNRLTTVRLVPEAKNCKSIPADFNFDEFLTATQIGVYNNRQSIRISASSNRLSEFQAYPNTFEAVVASPVEGVAVETIPGTELKWTDIFNSYPRFDVPKGVTMQTTPDGAPIFQTDEHLWIRFEPSSNGKAWVIKYVINPADTLGIFSEWFNQQKSLSDTTISIGINMNEQKVNQYYRINPLKFPGGDLDFRKDYDISVPIELENISFFTIQDFEAIMNQTYTSKFALSLNRAVTSSFLSRGSGLEVKVVNETRPEKTFNTFIRYFEHQSWMTVNNKEITLDLSEEEALALWVNDEKGHIELQGCGYEIEGDMKFTFEGPETQ